MFLRTATSASTDNYSELIDRFNDEICQAEAIVIGAGSGLSAAAGLAYSGKRFHDNFADFIAKYHYADMYSAGFYPYPTPEEYWAYWSRHIWLNRYAEDAGETYYKLLQLVQDKNHFVITTNVDHCFQKAGFDKRRLFYTQGDYGLFQCAGPCHEKTYDNREMVRRMLEEQQNMRISTELLPYCPKCGKPMRPNLRCDNTFVQDDGWHTAAEHYEDFIHQHDGCHLLFLELGVGGNTPVIIKYPFWQMTKCNPKAVYTCVNLGKAIAPQVIADRAICIDADIGKVINDVQAADKNLLKT